jgi:hypothetical protein
MKKYEQPEFDTANHKTKMTEACLQEAFFCIAKTGAKIGGAPAVP